MERTYDLFEVMPDGAPMWRDTVVGHEAAITKLKELASKCSNEVRCIHLPTKSVVAMMNESKQASA